MGGSGNFDAVYKKSKWQSAEGNGCLSGNSDPSVIISVLMALAHVLDDFNIQSMVDLPCGDMCYMKPFLDVVFSASPGFKYYGFDVVAELVAMHKRVMPWMSFGVLDARRDVLIFGDLLHSRALTNHMCTGDILQALSNINSTRSKYVT